MPRAGALVRGTVIVMALACALAYAADSLSVRRRSMHATATNPYETLSATRVLAIPQKGGKIEYQVDEQNPQQSVVCVHALFPHDGHAPCWYVKPRFGQPIPM